MLLRAAVGTAAPQATTPALGAAELVGAALEAFAVDPELLAAERARVRVLLIDDAQQLDPQAARLVRVLAAGTELALVAGDPNQAVFGFRGGERRRADSADDSPSVTLTVSHRCAPAVARAVSGIARRLPGGSGGRQIDGTRGRGRIGHGAPGGLGARGGGDDRRRVAACPFDRRGSVVADGGHRPVGATGRRAVAARVGRRRCPGGRTPGRAGRCPTSPRRGRCSPCWPPPLTDSNGEQALALLTGPIGRVDPVSLRQLRRTLQRANPGRVPGDFGDLLVDALPADAPLPGPQSRALRRVRAVLDAAARCHRDGQDPRYTLWAAWHRSGLQRRWLSASERGGPAGAQATRDLEAVTALFDITDHYVSRTPGASLRGLVEHVAALQLPGASPEPVSEAEQVRVLSAHAALGHEWDFVVIAGLQDGLWPNTIPRGGVLGTQRLLDVLDGVTEDASVRAPLLAEERRLLVAAMGRARRRLLVTAVDSDTGGAGRGGRAAIGVLLRDRAVGRW